MSSSLTWLDFSEQERRKVLDVVELFRERDTVDELGVGQVRDTFSDLLFPGTSTLHTRARYVLFIPWIYREIERSRAKSEEPWRHARKGELRLIDELAHSEDGEAAIGINARATLKIYASTIYWAALGRWGIRTYPQSQGQYHRWLRAGGPRTSLALDSDQERESFDTSGWHGSMPEAPERFPRGVSFRFEPHESTYVAERLVMSAPGSLLALLLERRVDVGAVDDPGALSWAVELPRHLADQLQHASCFSLAIHGAPLLYNLMLAELARRNDRVEEFEERLRGWVSEMTDRSVELRRWDRKHAFWDLLTSAGAAPPPPTRRFVDRWLDLAMEGDPEEIAGDRAARQLISERERSVKRGRARLHNHSALALWGGDAGTARLSYRWSDVQRIVGDILGGFEAVDA